MPQITIDVSDKAYAQLAHYAEKSGQSIEEYVSLSGYFPPLSDDFLDWCERLRIPLTSIYGFASTLLRDEDETLFQRSDRLEFYEIMASECSRLLHVIEERHCFTRMK